MDVKAIYDRRFSTKKFDESKKLTAEQVQQLKYLLRMSPSSTNVQPWHFIVSTEAEGKKRLAKSTQGFYSFNESKVLNASMVIVFCSKTDADDAFMKHVLDVEEADKRFPKEDIKTQTDGARKYFARDVQENDPAKMQAWRDKQVYLNVGGFLIGAAAMGLDTIPMEGFDPKALDEELGLPAKHLKPLVIVSVGYHLPNDFNAPNNTPKSRLPMDEIVTVV